MWLIASKRCRYIFHFSLPRLLVRLEKVVVGEISLRDELSGHLHIEGERKYLAWKVPAATLKSLFDL